MKKNKTTIKQAKLCINENLWNCKICNMNLKENGGELIEISQEIYTFICDNCLIKIIHNKSTNIFQQKNSQILKSLNNLKMKNETNFI